jgi:hypothetical protein
MMDTTNIETNLLNVRNLNNYSYSYTPFSNQIQNIPFITVASHNIQRSYNNKLSDIIITMMNKNIHILHICETNLIRTASEDTYEKPFLLQTYDIQDLLNPSITHRWHIINNPDPKNRGSGNAFIISSFCYQHISNIKSIKGRYLNITLTFKKQNNFHIMGIYIPNKQSNQYTNTTLLELKTLINNNLPLSQNNNNKIIIMGDFNINPSSTSTSKIEKDFFTFLKSYNLKDSHKHFFKNPLCRNLIFLNNVVITL